MWCAILLGILLVSRMVGADEDCVEGEDDCQAPTVTQTTDAQNSIYILTDENFAEIVKEEEMIMATFYAPWCVNIKTSCHGLLTSPSPSSGVTIVITPSRCLRRQ